MLTHHLAGVEGAAAAEAVAAVVTAVAQVSAAAAAVGTTAPRQLAAAKIGLKEYKCCCYASLTETEASCWQLVLTAELA